MRSKNCKFSDVVFTTVKSYAETNTEEVRKYKSLCKRSGGMLRTMGLVQYLAVLKARGIKSSEVHYNKLFEHLASELSCLGVTGNSNGETATQDLLDYVRELAMPQYMFVTREVLSLLTWHKRIADILIEGTAEEN